ncbi:sulfatase [bacterium]|nr:sulfatase [bacterium]
MNHLVHRFLNVWLALTAMAVVVALGLALREARAQGYVGKALDNTYKFTINRAVRESRAAGAAAAFFIAAAYVLARRRSVTRRRFARSLAIGGGIALLLLFVAAFLFQRELAAGHNKLYGQYVDIETFAFRALFSSVLTVPPPGRFILIFIFGAVLVGLAFAATAAEKRLFANGGESAFGAAHPAIWIASAIVLAVASIVGAANKPAAARHDPPDIILISIDTLRADHLPTYGYERDTSPALGELAANGVVVERHIAHAPWTLPSHMSMFTGVIPSRHGATQPIAAIADDMTTFPELLKNAGYATGGFATNILLGASYGFASAFDTYALNPNWNAGAVAGGAASWFVKQRKPAFLFLHIFDPHFPYDPPPAFRGRFGPEDEAVARAQKLDFYDFFRFMEGEGASRVAAVRDRYDEEILATDAALRTFFERLAEHRRLGDALIIVTSDHGEEFGEHGMWGHGLTLYAEMLNVPLIVKMPRGACAGSRLRDRLVPQKALFDLIVSASATPLSDARWSLCDESGAPASVAALAVDDPVIAEDSMLGPLRYAANGRERKLIEPTSVHVEGFVDFETGFELYDFAADALEKNNLLAGEENVVDAIRTKAPALHQEICRTRLAYAGSTEGGAVTLDVQTRERLKSLGYLTGESSGGDAAFDEFCAPVAP